MVFLLIGFILVRLSSSILILWVLVPPLTQLFAAVTGPLFAVCEEPRMGRLFASLTVMGVVNSAVLLAAALCLFRGSEFYDAMELVMACAVKFALFVCANVHISNLETGRDLSFMESSHAQADFLNRQLADGYAADAPSPSTDSLLVAGRALVGAVAPPAPSAEPPKSPPPCSWTLGRSLSRGSANAQWKAFTPSPF